jgi:hypothetical protein
MNEQLVISNEQCKMPFAHYSLLIVLFAFFKSYYYTCTNGGLIARTQNPASGWTAVAPVGGVYQRIAASNNTIVAVGNGGRIMWSDNGTTWTQVNPSPFGTSHVIDVIWNNERFNAVGWDGKAFHSRDGRTWEASWVPPSFAGKQINAVAGGAPTVVVGEGGAGGWSTNRGTSYATPFTISGGWTPNSAAHGTNLFIAVGNGGRIARSDNGTSWANISSTIVFGTEHITRVAFGENLYVAVGANGKMGYSTTVFDWQAIRSPFPNATAVIWSVAFCNGKFLAGIDGNIAFADANSYRTWSATTPTVITPPPAAVPEGLQYRIVGNTVTITGFRSGNRRDVDVAIPQQIEGRNVTVIEDMHDGELGSVTMPNTVTRIEEGAFSSSMQLKSITLSTALTAIGDGAFAQCYNLSAITLPPSLRTIGDRAFTTTNFGSIVIPNGVTTIGRNAFNLCPSLTSVTIPASVTSIGNRAFANCVNLKSVTMSRSTQLGTEVFDSGVTFTYR